MKKIKYFLPLLFFANFSLGQEESKLNEVNYTYHNHFYISPFHLLLNTIQMAYERDLLKSRHGFLLQGSMILSKNTDQELKFGLGGEFFFKIKLSRSFQLTYSKKTETKSYPIAYEFFYLSPFLQYNYFSQEHNDQTSSISSGNVYTTYTIEGGTDVINTFGGGVVIGGRLTLGKKFDMDLYAGGGVKYSGIDVTNNNFLDDYGSNIFEPGFTGVYPKLGFRLGIAF